ncbi:hypothetical protein WA158_000858 [Blastocystis sp. Blastoise]
MSSALINQLKKSAACEAVTFIKSGMIVGLGTGSTAFYAVEEVGRLLREGKLKDIICVSTSEATETQARSLDIPMTTLNEISYVDVAIDGADEVTNDLQLTKGKGAALFREKSVEILAKKLIIIVDQTKMVKKIASKEWIPVEVAPFGWKNTSKRLETLGCIPHLRMMKNSDEPLKTDNQNYILDCEYPNGIEDPVSMGKSIKSVVGVLEHGLFCNMATNVIIASTEGLKQLSK